MAPSHHSRCERLDGDFPWEILLSGALKHSLPRINAGAPTRRRRASRARAHRAPEPHASYT